MKDEDFAGLKKLDDMVQLPTDWQLLGYREIETQKGDKHRILEFDRPGEFPIGLFAHSCEKRGNAIWCKKAHIERQAKRAMEQKSK